MVFFIIAIVVIGLVIFHIVHYRLFCRYKADVNKSHCKDCKHLKICQKHHRK